MRPPSTVGRNELQSFQTLLQPRDQVSVWEGVRRRGRGRGLKPWRISNKFTEKKREQERGKPWKQSKPRSGDAPLFEHIVLSLFSLELRHSLIKPHKDWKTIGQHEEGNLSFASLLRILTPGLNLNSLGSAKTESMQLIMANESLFEQKRRGVH